MKTRLLVCSVFATLLLAVVTPAHAQTERCFPETGNCISGRIREFWEQNGGLPVFGYPITPQQEEQIEGKPFQVQWFERNRLELHPENARPYDVLLGRLGADRLAQQARDPFTFPRSEQQSGCRFFPETGHNICGAVLGAWRASGLELDDRRGKTEAENLALFGLPLSDLQTETLADGKEYQVQWFERGRFELHPENAPPFNVLLGLLGSEVRSTGAPSQPQPPAPPSQQVLTGSGSTVTQRVALPSQYNRVVTSHRGERNFIVWAYYENSERKALVANGIGDYGSMRPLEGPGAVSFEVQADGDWSLTLEPLPQEAGAASSLVGTGDYTSGFFTPARTGNIPFNATHDGTRNFIAWLHCEGGDDLAVNQIGTFSGSVMVTFRRGPCYWEVQADGNWTLQQR